MRRIPLTGLALLAVASLALAACGDGGREAAEAGETAGGSGTTVASTPPEDAGAAGEDGASGSVGGGRVAIAEFDYDPRRLSVAPGAEISFANADDTTHTATAEGGEFGTGSIEGDRSVLTAPDEPGRYPYYCSFHPFMQGSIVVE